MSQQRATDQNAASCSNNGEVITLDDDDEDEDVQFVGFVRPTTTVIDLCLSPSTSAAAAAARSGSGAGDGPATGSGSGATATASDPNSPSSSPGDAAKATSVDAANTGADSPSAAAAALECPICLQTCIHPARLPCGHIFCFLCVKGVAYKNRRCAMCRREIPAEFLDHPQLVNGIEDICTTRATEDGYQWYYEGRNGGWWAYDSRTNEEIEIAYAGYEAHKTGKPIASGTEALQAAINPPVNPESFTLSADNTIGEGGDKLGPPFVEQLNRDPPVPQTLPPPEPAVNPLDNPNLSENETTDEDDDMLESNSDAIFDITDEDDDMLDPHSPTSIESLTSDEDDGVLDPFVNPLFNRNSASPIDYDSDDSVVSAGETFRSSDYEDDDDMNSQGWPSSDSEDLDEIEPHPGRLLVQICGVMYAIDFMRMKQYPRSSPEKRRTIVRCKTTDAVPIGVKGVAGLSKYQKYN
ncbi:uncharacterized protein Rnf146 isoform X1 [Drosophila takahashii]|uniref:uncharacterized protein Rnf146 isoform X1 n=1 Tax=Drosophila takahashii TaxID=29030 RepID=UPI001CF89AB4|nr:uncharacterized protein LOC108059593 isoform X1 [Drosophila takahashii]